MSNFITYRKKEEENFYLSGFSEIEGKNIVWSAYLNLEKATNREHYLNNEVFFEHLFEMKIEANKLELLDKNDVFSDLEELKIFIRKSVYQDKLRILTFEYGKGELSEGFLEKARKEVEEWTIELDLSMIEPKILRETLKEYIDSSNRDEYIHKFELLDVINEIVNSMQTDGKMPPGRMSSELGVSPKGIVKVEGKSIIICELPLKLFVIVTYLLAKDEVKNIFFR